MASHVARLSLAACAVAVLRVALAAVDDAAAAGGCQPQESLVQIRLAGGAGGAEGEAANLSSEAEDAEAAEEERRSVDEQANATGDKAPVDDLAPAAGEQSADLQEAPAVQESASTTKEAPAVQESASTTKEAASTTEESASTTKEAASTTEESASTTEESASTTEESASTTKESASTTNESASTTEETASTTEEAAPTTEEPALAATTVAQDAVPAAKKSSPLAGWEMPTKVDMASTETEGFTCLTQADGLATVGWFYSWFYSVAEPGSPCVFGSDVRDEARHCIYDEGSYGEFGWCWTSEKHGIFGACGSECPSYGPWKVVADSVNTGLAHTSGAA